MVIYPKIYYLMVVNFIIIKIRITGNEILFLYITRDFHVFLDLLIVNM